MELSVTTSSARAALVDEGETFEVAESGETADCRRQCTNARILSRMQTVTVGSMHHWYPGYDNKQQRQLTTGLLLALPLG